MGGDLTAIAWNPASETPFMFATGSHDGAVRIWTTSPLQANSGVADGGTGGFGADISRTDSPVPEGHHTEVTTPSRERTVAFEDDIFPLSQVSQ